MSVFAERKNVEQVEEGDELAPRFAEVEGEAVLSAVATDAKSGEVLMVGVMNRAALEQTIACGYVHWWSRSRKVLWRKGESSGMAQRVVEVRIDDDQDAVWVQVEVEGVGASCHVGYRSCFYRRVEGVGGGALVRLSHVGGERMFEPDAMYDADDIPTRV